MLLGLTLDGGWKVVERLPRPPGSTGGHFSVGYKARNAKGDEGFLKAIDITKAMAAQADPAQELRAATEMYLFERELLEECKKLDRVVTAISDGTIQGATIHGALPVPVFYLIFELAEGDARSQASVERRKTLVGTFQILHHAINGMQQLHTKLIAHQDFKPSNVLHFSDGKAKVADVGRAVAKNKEAPKKLTSLAVPGDMTYAAPELLYGDYSTDWDRRRWGADLYNIGCLIVFFFIGTSVNPWLKDELNPAHRWRIGAPPGAPYWTDEYSKVLPMVREAFERVMQRVGQTLHKDIVEPDPKSERRKKIFTELMAAIRQLCDPDPALRGHPKDKMSNPFNLQRYVSLFNLLAETARVGKL